MFYEKFTKLCAERKVSKQSACAAAGLSSAAWVRWANGSAPSAVSLQKICDYFGVTTDSMIDNEKEIMPITDAVAARQQAFDRPEMKILFDAAKDAPASAILEAALGLMKLKEESND